MAIDVQHDGNAGRLEDGPGGQRGRGDRRYGFGLMALERFLNSEKSGKSVEKTESTSGEGRERVWIVDEESTTSKDGLKLFGGIGESASLSPSFE